jgi:23S rRNA pseudouridine1911/1915/1917 synthase
MAVSSLTVLYEDNHLLAVVKPAGLATMGVADETPSLLTLAKQYIKDRYAKPGDVYLGIVSRLDAPVTGIVLLARTSKAASRLSEQFRLQAVAKTYWAVVEGRIEPPSGQCVDWLRHDDRRRRVHVASPDAPGAKEARLTYRRLEVLGATSLVEVELQTGRKHQIRVQLAHRGHPVVGDRKYGSRVPFGPGIALHARRLVVMHPVRQDELELCAPLPPSWHALGVWEPGAGPGPLGASGSRR